MEPKLQLFLIILSLVFMVYIFALVRKENLELKYTLSWCFMGLVLFIIALQPRLVMIIANLL